MLQLKRQTVVFEKGSGGKKLDLGVNGLISTEGQCYISSRGLGGGEKHTDAVAGSVLLTKATADRVNATQRLGDARVQWPRLAIRLSRTTAS